VCISNAHILERKSPNHTTRTVLDFRKSLISDLIEGNSFRRDTQMQPPPAPEIRFNQEHFHHLKRSDKRSTCRFHTRRVHTFYSCAVCGIHMCPRRLKEGRGRPRDWGRGRVLQNRTWTDTIMMMEVQLLWRQLVIYEEMNVTPSQRQCSKILLLTKSFMPFLYDFKGSYFCAKDCYWHSKWMLNV